MSGETYVTVIGRLTKDPEMRFTPSGAAVAEFTVAVNARKFNKQTNEWENKPTKFWDCQAWNSGKQILADNVAEALRKGTSVIVHGEMETRTFEDREGRTQYRDALRVISVGKDLTWHQGNQPQASAETPAAGTGWGSSSGTGWNPDEPVF